MVSFVLMCYLEIVEIYIKILTIFSLGYSLRFFIYSEGVYVSYYSLNLLELLALIFLFACSKFCHH